MIKRDRGFTLIEIMVAIFVLVVGMVGVLALFPRGLGETKAAIEESNAALVAQSAYAALRNSVKQMTDNNLYFYHDGANNATAYDISTIGVGQSMGIPSTSTAVNTTAFTINFNTDSDFCQLGSSTGTLAVDYSDTPFDTDATDGDGAFIGQYSFNIQISYTEDGSTGNPLVQGLYDVAIYVRRGRGNNGRLIRAFYTQISIPTS